MITLTLCIPFTQFYRDCNIHFMGSDQQYLKILHREHNIEKYICKEFIKNELRYCCSVLSIKIAHQNLALIDGLSTFRAVKKYFKSKL